MRKIWSIMKGIIGKINQYIFKKNLDYLTDLLQVTAISPVRGLMIFLSSLAGKIPNQSKIKQHLENKLMKLIFLAPVTSLEIESITKKFPQFSPRKRWSNCQYSSTEFATYNWPLCIYSQHGHVSGYSSYRTKDSKCPTFIQGSWLHGVQQYYRPVFVMLSKVFDTVIYSPLINFLEDNTFFVKQLGFRKEKNASDMALMLLIDKLTQALEYSDYVIGMFLNFSKAYDTVNHILLEKLDHYYIRGSALAWFESYITNMQ